MCNTILTVIEMVLFICPPIQVYCTTLHSTVILLYLNLRYLRSRVGHNISAAVSPHSASQPRYMSVHTALVYSVQYTNVTCITPTNNCKLLYVDTCLSFISNALHRYLYANHSNYVAVLY